MAALDYLRNEVTALAAVSVGLPDAAMNRPYTWGDYDEEGLRFALLMAYHELIDLGVAIESSRSPPTPAQRILGGLLVAHASLGGLLVSASDSELDRAPGPEEWSLRAVVQHSLEAEAGFTRAISRGLALAASGRAQAAVANEEWATWAKPPVVEGDKDAVLATLAASRDAVTAASAGLSDEELSLKVYFWEGEPFPVRFRLLRFELHLQQHTVQAEKTLAGIGHPPSEAERLVRLVYRGLGAVEAAMLGAGDRVPYDLLTDAAASLRTRAAEIRQAAV